MSKGNWWKKKWKSSNSCLLSSSCFTSDAYYSLFQRRLCCPFDRLRARREIGFASAAHKLHQTTTDDKNQQRQQQKKNWSQVRVFSFCYKLEAAWTCHATALQHPWILFAFNYFIWWSWNRNTATSLFFRGRVEKRKLPVLSLVAHGNSQRNELSAVKSGKVANIFNYRVKVKITVVDKSTWLWFFFHPLSLSSSSSIIESHEMKSDCFSFPFKMVQLFLFFSCALRIFSTLEYSWGCSYVLHTWRGPGRREWIIPANIILCMQKKISLSTFSRQIFDLLMWTRIYLSTKFVQGYMYMTKGRENRASSTEFEFFNVCCVLRAKRRRNEGRIVMIMMTMVKCKKVWRVTWRFFLRLMRWESLKLH